MTPNPTRVERIPRASYAWAVRHGMCTPEQADQRSLDGLVTLRDLRHLRGLSLPALQTRMAQLGVAVTDDQLSAYERGLMRPRSPEVRRAWARALGLPLRHMIIPAWT